MRGKQSGSETGKCYCGHDERHHRRNGKCTKCGCKSYGETAHSPECRCEPCCWNRVLKAEGEIKTLNKQMKIQTDYISDELQPFINKHEGFLGQVFKITPKDLIDLQNLRERENAKELTEIAGTMEKVKTIKIKGDVAVKVTPKPSADDVVKRKLIGKKPVQPESKAPQTTP